MDSLSNPTDGIEGGAAELAAARAALAHFFERLWPDPAGSPVPPPRPEEIMALEKRYRQAQRSLSGMSRAGGQTEPVSVDGQGAAPKIAAEE